MSTPQPTVPHLPTRPQLDWRRALGVHLWYGCQPTATVAEALASYTAAVESGAAPPPLPLFAEQAAGSGAGASASSGGAFDVAFELLRLHAVGSDPEASGSPAALQPLLARLLRYGGRLKEWSAGLCVWAIRCCRVCKGQGACHSSPTYASSACNPLGQALWPHPRPA